MLYNPLWFPLDVAPKGNHDLYSWLWDALQFFGESEGDDIRGLSYGYFQNSPRFRRSGPALCKQHVRVAAIVSRFLKFFFQPFDTLQNALCPEPRRASLRFLKQDAEIV